MGLPIEQAPSPPVGSVVVASAYPAPTVPQVLPLPTYHGMPAVAASASPTSVPDASVRMAIANVRAKRAAVATIVNLLILNLVCLAVWYSTGGQLQEFWPKWVLFGSGVCAYAPVSRWFVGACVHDVFSKKIANAIVWWLAVNLTCWTLWLMITGSTTLVLSTATWPVWVSAGTTIAAAMQINSIVKSMPVTTRELNEQMERMLPP